MTKPTRPDHLRPIKLATPEVMQTIRDVISQTTVPSWVSSVPRNFGDAAAGTLKADEWRTLITIYLPIALIFAWGELASHPTPYAAARFREVLDHTMLLVSTIVIACKRNMSEYRCQAYLHCMTRYISMLTSIHPHATHRPYGHMSLHLPHFFSLFGPARAFWTYPFERLIGQIQRLISNHRVGKQCLPVFGAMSDIYLGQMESTLLASFLKASKVKRWLADPQNPSIVKEIKALFDKVYSPGELEKNSQTIELVDDDDTGTKFLATSSAPEIVQRFLQSKATGVRLHARFKRRGLVYSILTTHEGNSQILYYPEGNTSLEPAFGIITFIYSEKTKSTIQPAAAVQRLTPVGGDTPNPFANYPHWPAQLHYRVSSNYERVQPDWVHGHFSRWNISSTQMVAVPLNRVSRFLYRLSLILTHL